VKLAVKCIHTALERDAATRNNVCVMKITPNNIEKISAERINEIRAGFKRV
jgi:20S proteasome alpha/beta subunit